MSKLFTTIILTLSCLTLIGCDKKQQVEPEEQEIIESEFGYVAEQTIEEIQNRFIEQVANNPDLKPCPSEFRVEDDRYWYTITKGLYLVITPVTFHNDITKDITDTARIYVEKNIKEEAQILEYATDLIIANNPEITLDDAKNLIEEAIANSVEETTANNGQGIRVGYVKTEDHQEYQVIRLYR